MNINNDHALYIHLQSAKHTNDMSSHVINYTLRVGIPAASPPFIFPCGVNEDHDFKVRPNCRYPGISLETFDMLMSLTRINYILVELNDTSAYGSPTGNGICNYWFYHNTFRYMEWVSRCNRNR